MFRLIVVLLPLIASAQDISFTAVTPSVVEQRLGSFAKKNDGRVGALRAIFEDAGCSGEKLTESPVKRLKWPNLVCLMPGSGVESAIIVGAHFDHIEDGDGVVDNWSGASLLPSLYQGLSGIPRRHTFYFVGFSGEEKGLVGSQAYAKQVSDEHRKVSAMVNMDTLGLGETKAWVSHADPKLVDALGRVANAMKLPIAGVNVEEIGTTDSESFRTRKVPSITIHSLTSETLPILHTKQDKIEKIRQKEYYDTYKLLLGYLAFLDQILD